MVAEARNPSDQHAPEDYKAKGDHQNVEKPQERQKVDLKVIWIKGC